MLCVCHTTPTQKLPLFACLSSGWATTAGKLLGPKVGNSNNVFPKDTATRYRIGSRAKVSQPFDYLPGASTN